MNRYILLISITVALGGLLFGFDTAVISGTLTDLERVFHLDEAALGWVVSSALVGCVIGALFVGNLADRFGRKPLLLLSALFFLICAIGSGRAQSAQVLVLFRIIGGIAVGMASVICPIYISEIAPAKERGRLTMMQQIAIVIGILLAFASNWIIANTGLARNVFHTNADNYWRLMFEAQLIPAIVFFIGLLLVPESPRWLLTRNNETKAVRTLRLFYSEDEVAAVLQHIKIHISAADAPKTNWKEVFALKNRKRLLIGITFAGIAQLTGINIIFYYAPKIFEQTQTGSSVLFQTVLTGIINLVFTLLALFFIDKLGRKKLMLFGSLAMAVSMAVLSIIFYRNTLDNYFVLFLILLYIAFFAVSWGATIWVYIAEIFPNSIRGTASSIATFANWGMNFLVSLTFPMLLSRLGGAGTFGLYALFNFISFLFVYRFIFETKGVSLEEIESIHV
ncbi:sugar porter family MFS transporter [Niabella sp. CC-SYL272]|uniref:sugar porter family MFS transporter n=1 Tax=Niabella agricola TaxID=2891571 RepID=UPI001F485362|nr:sugar porter family MFS transporter [Niabella agricola]MCF3108678.1 sugar porter family MFS transporter [Niabella agricola]